MTDTCVLSASPLTLAILVYLGVVGSTLLFLTIFTLIRQHSATRSALPGYLIPVVTTSLGALLLGEQATSALLLAHALVLDNVLIVTKARARLRQRTTR